MADSRLLRLILIVTVLIFDRSSAYVIDPVSCQGGSCTRQFKSADTDARSEKEARRFLKDQIDCAFDAVQAAVDAVKDENRDAGITRLLHNLLSPSDDPNYVTPVEAILARFEGITPPPRNPPSDRKPDGMDFGYPGILSMRNEATGIPHQDDVKFFCDTDRFEKVKIGGDKVGYRENDFDELLEEDEGDPFKECDAPNMAFTYVNPKKEKWSTITLCPWFLSYAMKERWPSCDAWNEKIKSLSAQILDRAVTRFAYTPIDLFSLFDKVIIHELTHTRSGGGARDVNMNGLTDGKKAYGFKKCRDISGRESREGEFIPETVPHNNADTFAIFASGVRLINAGGTIDDRGRITRPANQKRWPSMAVPFDS